jgi:hypothetical protein
LSLQRPYLARKAARHLDSHQPSATYDLSYLHLKRLAQDQGPLLPTVQFRQPETGHPEHRQSRCSGYYSRCEQVGCRTSIVTIVVLP